MTISLRKPLKSPAIKALLVVPFIIASAFIAVRGAGMSGNEAFRPFRNPVDFRAFYCAGKVMRLGADPYRVEPLRTCEESVSRQERMIQWPGLVVPAPLPPYALLSFGILSLVPYPSAVVLWYWLLICACIVTTSLLVRLTGMPVYLTCTLWTLLAMSAIVLGQIIPLCALFLVLGARALQAGRFLEASLVTTCTMIEPHVGLPSCLALFAWRSKTRLPMTCCALVLITIMLLFAGPGITLEYFTQAIPDQAHSEVGAFAMQYSLASALNAIGIDSRTALALGAVDYVAMSILGILVARALVREKRDEALLILVPPAFAVFGGTYMHVYQLVIAAPAILILLSTSFENKRLAVLLAVSFLGILTSTLLETVYGGGLVRPGSPENAASFAHSHGANIASTISEVWNLHRNPIDPRQAVQIWLLKIPAAFGLLIFVASSLVESRAVDSRRMPAPIVGAESA